MILLGVWLESFFLPDFFSSLYGTFTILLTIYQAGFEFFDGKVIEIEYCVCGGFSYVMLVKCVAQFECRVVKI